MVQNTNLIFTSQQYLLTPHLIKTSDTPHYENVPFEIPDNWEWCKLGDIVNFQGGYAYKSNTYVNQSDWQVIRIGNVKNDNLVFDTQPVFVEEVIGWETKKYLSLNPQLHSRSATYIKRNGLLIRKITIKSSRPFQCAYHPLTP